MTTERQSLERGFAEQQPPGIKSGDLSMDTGPPERFPLARAGVEWGGEALRSGLRYILVVADIRAKNKLGGGSQAPDKKKNKRRRNYVIGQMCNRSKSGKVLGATLRRLIGINWDSIGKLFD